MTVAVAPIGDIDPVIPAEAAEIVRDRFASGVHICAPLPEPPEAWDSRRGQESCVAVMQALARAVPGGMDRMLGLTARDLFIPMLTFVFGQAQLGGAVAVVSVARLHPEFYGAAADPRLLRWRLAREVVHELGHTFGLVHCHDARCVMSLATTILHVDRKSDDFCIACRRLVDERLGKRGKEDI